MQVKNQEVKIGVKPWCQNFVVNLVVKLGDQVEKEDKMMKNYLFNWMLELLNLIKLHDLRLLNHIFHKPQVTLNKNAHNSQHHFGAQFFMLFHMV